jgi:hypothetical protein
LPRLFGTLEGDVRNGKFEPGEGALEYGHATPGYDINELIDKDMAELRKVLKDLRRAELIAVKEHDRVRAAARDVASAQAQSTSNTQGRRTSGVDQLRHKGVEIVAAGKYEREADEMSDTEAVLVESDSQQADIVLRSGLETAARVQEQAIDAIPLYTHGEGTAEEDAIKVVDAAVAAAAITETAETAFNTERRRLHTAHREARAIVDKWREALRHAKERERRLKQGGLLTKAIMEVQTRAANRRRDAAESEEDFCITTP